MTIAAGYDIETTGLEWLKDHRIIEIAVSFYLLETGQHCGSLVRRCNPQRPIDPKAQEVHHISFEEVAFEPIWPEIAPTLSLALNKADVIVAHNGIGFDMPFTNHELARVGVPTVDKPVVDTMVQGRWATPFGKLPSLSENCFATGVEYDPTQAHAALYDVSVMMEAFFFGFRTGFFTIPTPQLFTAQAA